MYAALLPAYWVALLARRVSRMKTSVVERFHFAVARRAAFPDEKRGCSHHRETAVALPATPAVGSATSLPWSGAKGEEAWKR